MACLSRIAMRAALSVLIFVSVPAGAAEIVYPVAGGTLVDGGDFGSLDGVADSWNWDFGPTGFAGAVTLTAETPACAVEHRMVWEYDLRGVDFAVPIKATLSFTTRGVSVFPFPDVVLHVYSYPADLIESPGDFSAGPAVLQGVFAVTAMQGLNAQVLDVTELVGSALTGAKKVAFRFQIDPGTRHVTNQVFIDALDAAPETKPFLSIGSALPGDADSDGDVDLADSVIFSDCLAGPETPPVPTLPDVSAADCLWAFDGDGDSDVDLNDLSELLGSFVRE